MKKIHLFVLLACSVVFFSCASTSKAEVSEKKAEKPAVEQKAKKVDKSRFDIYSSQSVDLPSSEAMDFIKTMGLGWNLGNTLDSVDCGWVSNDLGYETAWGNPKTNKLMIQFIKESGFDTIRIPVTWKNHVGEAPDYEVRKVWMDRVQEVVDWAIEEDMYVILNMHHESEWITKASKDYDTFIEKYTAIWSQIADRFGDYSDHLIFESMNEIGFDDIGVTKGCQLMNKINSEFTSLIRNSGKNNANRYLLLAGYWTDIQKTAQGIVLPQDDKVILSVHYYSPSPFAIAEKGTSWGYTDSWGDFNDFTSLNTDFKILYSNFISKGVPVIVGEYGCLVKDKIPEDRVLYLSSVAKYARHYGCCPVFWDNGEEMNRKSLKWRTEGLVEALMKVKNAE